MKEYFEHKYGYLNIDSENIYFTKSGNWSEARGLKENKSDPTTIKTINQKVLGFILLVIVVIINIFGLYSLIEMFGSITSSIIIIGWFIYYSVSKNLKQFKPNFLIPIVKIKKLETVDKNQIKFIYQDGDNLETIQQLKVNADNYENLIRTLKLVIKE